ncbi:MAG: SGNH/GDSL hydrolase family protein [Clostridia bacterium]|nr:SGNH/GDSL hydrolase family protein [Clostridia bacterium]
MNKKLTLFLASLLCLFCLLAVVASATETVVDKVYISSGGKGEKTGLTPEDAAATMGTAVKKLTADGTVYIVDTFRLYGPRAMLTDIAHSITFKPYNENSVFHFDGEWYVSTSTSNNTYTFDIPITVDSGETHKIVGGFNNFVFTEKFVVNGGGDLEFYGGFHQDTEEGNSVTKEKKGIATADYSITVKNGRFSKFYGGNLRNAIEDYYGSLAGHVTINISGGTFGKSGTYNLATNNKSFDAFSVSGMSVLANGATLNISGGTFNTPIYIQGRTDTISSKASEISKTVASNKKYYAMDGDVKVNITGGTFNGGEISAYYTHASYTTLIRGNFDVSITGGTFKKDTVIDATQVVPYKNSTKKATITYQNVTNITPKRFDVVNGTAKTYDEPIRVVFIGDSITEGYAPAAAGVVRLTDGYPAKFLAKCEAEGKEVIVSNFGIGSAGFLPTAGRYYMNMLAYPMVTEETEPDYVFFAMGTNDANAVGGTNGAYQLFEKNFEDIVTLMGEKDTVDKVLITNAIYRNSNMSASHRMAGALHAIQKRVADKLHEEDARYNFVDLYGLTLPMAKYYTLFAYGTDTDGDNLHPTKEGLKAMGEFCYDAAFNDVYAPQNDYHLTEIYLSDKGRPFGEGTKDSPINNIHYANGLAAYGKEVTFYIDGTFTLPDSTNVFLTENPSKLSIVGTSDEAKLVVRGNTLKCGTNTTFDNIILENNYSEGTYIVGCYNDITITDSVKTTSVTGKAWHFTAGYTVYTVSEPVTTGTFDTEKSASSDKDCTVIVNGGSFTRFVLGNIRLDPVAPIGSYTGEMIAHIGDGATISTTEKYVGIVGHNYNQGKIAANTSSHSLKEYATFSTVSSPIVKDDAKNTGSVKFAKSYDANYSGKLDLGDVLLAVKYHLNGLPRLEQPVYGMAEELTLLDVVSFIVNTVK